MKGKVGLLKERKDEGKEGTKLLGTLIVPRRDAKVHFRGGKKVFTFTQSRVWVRESCGGRGEEFKVTYF